MGKKEPKGRRSGNVRTPTHETQDSRLDAIFLTVCNSTTFVSSVIIFFYFIDLREVVPLSVCAFFSPTEISSCFDGERLGHSFICAPLHEWACLFKSQHHAGRRPLATETARECVSQKMFTLVQVSDVHGEGDGSL